MKAKFLALAALVLGLASCQTEPESLGVNVGGEQDVTVCVSLPEVTRANSAEGAFVNVVNSDQYTIRYILQVFYGETAAPQDVKYSDGTSVNFDVRLVPGRDYKFVVWADVVEEVAEPTDLHYNTTDLTAITFNGEWNAMDETRDAFTVVEPIENYNGSKSINLTLTRPFAKLRVQTTDLGELANLGLAPYKTVVTYTTAHYRSFNAFNGVPTDKTYASKTHELINLESYGYEANTLFVDYFYATESPETVKFEMKVYDKDEVEPLKTNNFSTDIPVQRNYLTTISGNILTDGNNVKVDIVDNGAFEGEKEWPEEGDSAQELAFAAMFGGEVTLTEDVVLTQPLEIVEGANVVINLNGKTITGNWHKNDGAVIKNNGTLTIVGGTISSTGENGGSAIQNNGTLTVNDATLNGAPNANGSWPSYTVNNTGVMTLENTIITSYHGAVASYGDDAVVTLNKCTIDMAGIPGFTSHGIYTYNNGKVVVNGGTYENKATDQAASGASVINGAVEVNAGIFSGRIENYFGTPILKGGTFSVKPNANFIAAGYKTVQSGDKYMVVKEDVGGVATDNATLDTAIKNAQDGDTIALNAGEYVIPDSAVGKTITFVGTGAPEDTLITAQNDGAAEGNCDYSLRGSKATFENVTITTTGTYFPGYAGCQGTYKNCIINGVFTLYDSSSFEDCTFNISGDLYNVWTWGAAEATFTNCTFNCDGKAMLLYGQANTKLTMNNCVFNDNGDDTVTGKAAIEIGNDYNKSYELTVNNATVNGFAINPNGFVTGTTLWANKNSMPGDKLKVTVDGLKVWDAGYEYLAAGILSKDGEYLILNKTGLYSFANEVNVNGNAFAGKTVKLTADIDLNNEAWTPVGQTGATTFNGVFDGQNYTISNLNVDSSAQTGAHYSSGLFGWVESHTAGRGHIKNVKINGATIVGHHNCGALVGYITQETALVENCHVTGAAVTCTKANDDADGDKAGALIGNATVATPVKDCTAADSTVSAGRDAGQVIGVGKEANVTGCSATNVTVSANGTSTGANVRNEVIGRLLN